MVGKALSPSITRHWRHWRPLLCSVSHVALGIVGSQEGHHLLTTFTGIISWLWRHLLRNHCLDVSISIFMIYTLVKINSALIVACTGCPVKLFTPVFKSNLCLSCKSDLHMEYLLFSLMKIDAKMVLHLKII